MPAQTLKPAGFFVSGKMSRFQEAEEICMKKVALILFGFILFSCTTVRVIPVNNAKFNAPTTNVTVYSNRNAIEKEYKEIAIIFSDSDAGMVAYDKIINKILEKAKTIGADGIIIEEKSTSAINMYGGLTSFKVTAIQFIE